MRQAAARQGDQIVPTGTHLHRVTLPNGSTVPRPFVCAWEITRELSANVRIGGKAAATVESGGDSSNGAHELPPGTKFTSPPTNLDQAKITAGSAKVRINGRNAARHGDTAETCNEPAGAASGTVVVVGASRVFIGG